MDGREEERKKGEDEESKETTVRERERESKKKKIVAKLPACSICTSDALNNVVQRDCFYRSELTSEREQQRGGESVDRQLTGACLF